MPLILLVIHSGLHREKQRQRETEDGEREREREKETETERGREGERETDKPKPVFDKGSIPVSCCASVVFRTHFCCASECEQSYRVSLLASAALYT